MAIKAPTYRVLLLVADAFERDHWMLKQLLKRCQLERGAFEVVTIEEFEISQLVSGSIKVLCPMGQEALMHVTGAWDIERWFGHLLPHHTIAGVTVLPLFAPSKLLPKRGGDDEEVENPYYKKKSMRHPPRYQGAEMMMLKRAVRVAAEGYVVPSHEMLLDPSPEAFNHWVEVFASRQASVLSWDIETPYKTKVTNEEAQEEAELGHDDIILRISFAYNHEDIYHSVSIPWEPRYRKGIDHLLATRCEHVGWNIRAFDIPKVEKHTHVGAAVVWDGMDAFHLVQTDLDRGLEAVTAFYAPDVLPWKHLSQQPGRAAEYSAVDSYAALRNWEGIKADLTHMKLWDVWVHQNSKVMPTLEVAGKNGCHIDVERQQKLGEMLDVKEWELLQDAQQIVPKRHHKRKLYTRQPKDKPGVWIAEASVKEVKTCGHCGQPNINVRHNCDAIKEGKGQLVTRVEVESTSWYCDDPGEGITTKQFKDWLKDNGFNPNSSKQMLDYMRFYGHPVGTNHKTKEDSADTKHLQKLVKSYGAQHPLYKLAIELHKVSKAQSTYVVGLAPDASGRVYTTYTNTPSTWRLSSRNVNMQNQGKRETNPYAKEARKTILPPPGMVFVQADSSAIEAVFVGYFMASEDFIQLARDGVHDFLTCKKLGLPFEVAKLSIYKKQKGYAEMRERMKRVVHGTNYGMGPYLMHMNEPETFPTLKAAKDAQNFYKEAVPALFQWQFETRVRVKKEGYLVNPWGVRHYFYDVFTYETDDHKIVIGPDGNPKVKLGADAKRVVAFKPQSSAGMFARDNCVLLSHGAHKSWVLPANFTVHDSYAIAVPDNKADIEGCTELMTTVLTRPIPQMEGLKVGCEVEYGPDWGTMTKICTIRV